MSTDPLTSFTPVPRQRMRRGGWSAARQREFIQNLAETGSVRAACRRMGVGEHHIYKLRGHPEAESFRKAWEAALDMGIKRIEDVAMDRALYGVDAPVFYHGKAVGTRKVYNDRLLMFMLNNRASDRFAHGNARSIARPQDSASPDDLARLKAQWRKEWEAEQPAPTTEEVRASIDRKIAEVRRQFEAAAQHRWAALSDETRAAWAHFLSLRDRDLEAMEADAATRKVLEVDWDAPENHFDPPEQAALPAPSRKAKAAPEGADDFPDLAEQARNRHRQAPPPPPRTTWTLKDEGFDP